MNSRYSETTMKFANELLAQIGQWNLTYFQAETILDCAKEFLKGTICLVPGHSATAESILAQKNIMLEFNRINDKLIDIRNEARHKPPVSKLTIATLVVSVIAVVLAIFR